MDFSSIIIITFFVIIIIFKPLQFYILSPNIHHYFYEALSKPTHITIIPIILTRVSNSTKLFTLTHLMQPVLPCSISWPRTGWLGTTLILCIPQLGLLDTSLYNQLGNLITLLTCRMSISSLRLVEIKLKKSLVPFYSCYFRDELLWEEL